MLNYLSFTAKLFLTIRQIENVLFCRAGKLVAFNPESPG
jgi:hypothetical protein